MGRELVSCVSSTSFTAVGLYRNFLGVARTLIESWNGSSWALDSSPHKGPADNVLQGVSCLAASCTAVGNYTLASGGNQTLIKTWDGSLWKIVDSPNSSYHSWLDGVSCVSASSCTAVGAYDNAASPNNSLIESWNGSNWTIQSSPNKEPGDNDLHGVSCVSATSCEAVGSHDIGGNGYQSLFESWDGSSWIIQPSPYGGTGNQVLPGVSCPSASYCEAVGYAFNSGGGATQTLIESYSYG